MTTKIQSTRRIQHTSNSGIEILREFHVEPYEDYIDVIHKLQGFVEDGKRTPPKRDPYVPVCYCTETRVDQWHEEQLTTSDDLTDGAEDDIDKSMSMPGVSSDPWHYFLNFFCVKIVLE